MGYIPDDNTILHLPLGMDEWCSFSVALPGFSLLCITLAIWSIFHCGHNLDFSYS